MIHKSNTRNPNQTGNEQNNQTRKEREQRNKCYVTAARSAAEPNLTNHVNLLMGGI